MNCISKFYSEDKIYRSFGLLSNARILRQRKLICSDVRLGINMGIIKDIRMEKIDQIMLMIQPASLQKFVGKQISSIKNVKGRIN